MLKTAYQGAENRGSVPGTLYEQYLPGVYQYISCWLDNNQLTEELTLASLKKALLRNGKGSTIQHDCLITVFTIARNEVQDHFRESKLKIAWPGLSDQEREVMAFKLGASLDNRSISSILGLSESSVTSIIVASLCKLRDCQEIKQLRHN